MRLVALLLRLFPAAFRLTYGDEMRAMYARRFRDASGALPLLILSTETVTDMTWTALQVHLDILRQDLRYALRTLAVSPGFALTAVLVTALGIGANTAAFSVADFVLLRPLPYAQPDRLVKVWEKLPAGGRSEASPFIYRHWKSAATSFASMGAWHPAAVNLVGEGDPQRLEASAVTASLLPTLGVRPALGRLFDPAEERSGFGSVVILSHGVWTTQFGADPAIVGRRVLLDGSPRVVIGVMPAGFSFPSRSIGVWMLMGAEEQADEEVGNSWWEVVGRLKPGVTREQANAELAVVARRLEREYPKDLEQIGAMAIGLRDELSRQSRLLLLALCGAAACVLLIACTNLANLLLARALARRRELLVRAALGAGRERLVRQSITESFVLATLGGALGVLVAYAAVPLLTRLVPSTLPVAQAPSVDPRVLAFAAVLTAITGLAFGVVPAWRSAGQLDMGALREGARTGGGRRARARAVLVVAEVMACVVLLVSSGLLMRALLRLQGTDAGFSTGNVLTLRTALPLPRYDTTALRARFYREVLAEVRAIPGVRSAAYVSGLPMAMTGGIWTVLPEGRPDEPSQRGGASARFVTPGYFASLGIPLRRGRDVSEADVDGQPWVAVVSESFARRWWPGEDPIGKRFDLQGTPRTVVGVVGDVRVRGPERPSEPQVYLAYQQTNDGQSTPFYPKDMVIHAAVPAATLVPAVRRVVQRIDPQQPISNVRMMSEVVSETTAARAVQVRVLGAFALVAFLLAAVGIHGLLSYTVSSRQREIGVRMALGAQRGEIVRMVMRQGVALTAAGVVPGILLAYAGGRAMRSLLAGLEPADAITFSAAVALCVVMTLVGTLLPTLRAVRVDPAAAFRAEA